MTKRNILLTALLSVTVLGGAAVAADRIGDPKGPMQADTNGDGIVSRSEFFTAAETRFKKVDANGDRKLMGDEMKDRGGRFARQDANNDGTLSFAEAATRTAADFTRLDADRDGKLTPEELGPHDRPGRHGGPGGPNMQRGADGPRGPMGIGPLDRVDTNKDGRISREEMRAQADQRFDRLDANKDGVIDQTELQAMRGRGPGAPGGAVGDAPPPPPPPAPGDAGD